MTVLAVRRGSEVNRERMRALRLRGGDALSLRTIESEVAELRADRSRVVPGEADLEAVAHLRSPSPTTTSACSLLPASV